ncbi:piggyBac transposable element-derived protein 4-like [Patiria miniata]|uniref:PiggyBac transposable element-derived protein domain-containing protein n=1 Tax=Patiria miniata TaxID=46514 RepID=A0A913YZK6_PATMI|nr:piggyBac transposable element-derived protein 4-like [Patiria miniata]
MASTSKHIDTSDALQSILQDDDDMGDCDVESLMSEESGSEVGETSSSDMSISEESDKAKSEDDDYAPPPKRPAHIPPKGRPKTVPAQPQRVQAQPQRVQAQPQTVQAQPQTVQAQPQTVPGQPLEYVAKSGMTWTTDAPPAARRRRANLVTQAAGPKHLGGAKTKLELFQLFFTTTMMNTILMYTNEEGLTQRGRAWSRAIAMMELSSAIGLLLFFGLSKVSRASIRSQWRKGPFAKPLAMATMTGTRFQDILTLLRFDDKRTREGRKKNDKFAPIRGIFDDFAESCRRHYSAGEFITVDEQLVAFRGRCPFRQYMPKKPAKYGIKFWLCVDVDMCSHYVLNIFPYLGKQAEGTQTNLGSKVVKDLVQPLYNTGRNANAKTAVTFSCTTSSWTL